MKNTHLEHLEDEILNNGSEGGRTAISFLNELGKMLSEPQSSIQITTKWDGSPSIICGVDPSNNLFFVGTKSVFSKQNPKICYTEKDIDLYYDPSSELNSKLKTCLEYLSKLNIKGVLQGDLLYTNDKKIRTINGTKSIVFRPNTITYAIPLDSSLAEKIKNTKLGIVFHTKYTGSSLESMNANFDSNSIKVNGNTNVYVGQAKFSDVSGIANFNKIQLVKYNSLLKKTQGSLKQASKFLDIINGTGDSKFLMSKIFKTFFNSYIRSGKAIKNARDISKDFYAYYSNLLDKEISTKTTQRVKDKYLKIKNDGLKFIQQNQRSIYMTIASYMNLQSSKNMIIKQLEKVNNIGTFIETESGYKVTSPEGFVAIKSGKVLKLVDRLEFSRANFTIAKDWNKK